VGPGERVVVVLVLGIIALAVMNAGLVFRRRWLSMCGLAGILGFLAFLIREMVEAAL